MFLSTFLVFSSSVLLASHASVLSTHAVDPTTTWRAFSFSAKATPNANKGSFDNHSLVNEFNMEYTGRVSVGGQDFTLLIDTGSSDLWVTTSQKLKLTQSTNKTVNLTYGIGSAYGTLAYAPVAFGGYHVDDQAFLLASKTVDQAAEGILGLGLDGLSALERTARNTNISARSVMASVFEQHPDTPRLVGLALERTDDGEDTAGGVLTIGSYDTHFSNVTSTPRMPVTPASSARWTIALEGMTIDGKPFALASAVKGTKKGQAIALIDSGTSLAYIPHEAVNAIYGRINGSVHVQTATQDAWFVPCLAQVNLSFTFGNVPYPINPMELTSPVRMVDQRNQYTVCINAFRPPLRNTTDRDFDYLLGDVFMRNVYSVFNFGNASLSNDAKNASIQFLSRTNRDQVFTDFARHRKESLRMYPALYDLSKLHSDGTTEGGGRLEPPSAD